MKLFALVVIVFIQSASSVALASEWSSPWIQCKSIHGSPHSIRNYFYGAPESTLTSGKTEFTLQTLQIVEPLSLSTPYLGSATATLAGDKWIISVKLVHGDSVSSWSYTVDVGLGFDPEPVAVHYQMVRTGTAELLEESQFEVQCSTSELLP